MHALLQNLLDPEHAAFVQDIDAKLDILRRAGLETAAPVMPQQFPPERDRTKGNIKGPQRNANSPVAQIVTAPQTSGRPLKPLPDPTAAPQDNIIVPSEMPEESPQISQRLPDFGRLDDSRKTGLLKYLYLESQRAETILAKNLERYRQMVVAPIVDQATAQRAAETYSPSLFLGFDLTFNQANTLLASVIAAIRAQGVAAPASWFAPLQTPPIPEDGNDES